MTTDDGKFLKLLLSSYCAKVSEVNEANQRRHIPLIHLKSFQGLGYSS